MAVRITEASPSLSHAFDRLSLAIEQIGAEDLSGLGAGPLEARLVQLETLVRTITAEHLRTISEIERKQTFRRDGHRSTTAYVAHTLGVSSVDASKQAHQALALSQMPLVREALSRGDLSISALAELTEVQQVHPEAFAQAEPELLEAALSRPVKELRRHVGSWSNRIDAQAALKRAAHLRERRWLTLTPVVGGMGRIRGELDPETHELVAAALRGIIDRWVKTGADDRTHAQRMVDGLAELTRSFSGDGSGSTSGERPHVSVVVDLESLERRAGKICELETSGVIHPEAARRLACDASVSRIITKGSCQPLDVGRQTPVVSSAIKRALVIRDRGCAFPGCDAPPSWCDAHHITHWADGGETSLKNTGLLCRRHHWCVHEGGFSMEMTEMGLVFRRPDGTVIDRRS
jgi:Domain of unknown function (DUF222)